ncbi:LolA family protein [Limisalsivibrio acetivorans]|uniref:LolA family protein n=1 Tax=Limisalsivibrio acetivorans TaxID=1304888 RepID=UPI0003B6A31E|nr:outer-membrane lipoprotein carrier protein LolA [Limisalsivibrio acetivorans]
MKRFLILIMLIVPAFTVYGATIDEVLTSFKSLETYSADFTQTTEIEGFGSDEYSGSFFIRNGEKALWDYDYPYKQFYLFTKDGVDYYDGDLKQLVRQRSMEGNQNAITMLMIDIGNIRKSFDVEMTGEKSMRLNPKQDIGVKYIDVLFEGNEVLGIVSEDNAGNKTSVSFKNIKTNKPLPEGVFTPEIPEGTEIFEY